MDLLASLHLHELPEQQTKINKQVSSALKSNPDIRLGFDACLVCASKLKLSEKADTCCKVCKRVWYCSKECRRRDSDTVCTSDEERALGHSSIICALLKLCRIDDLVEDPNSSDKFSITEQEKEASRDRIISEYESYPATLANVLMDASCFQPSLNRFKKKRRGKVIRQSDLDASQSESKKSLTFHVIGASEEAELWGDMSLKHSSCKNVYGAYSEALTQLVSLFSGISTINLIFVGPNCPIKDIQEVRIIEPDSDGHVHGHDNVTSSQRTKKRKHGGLSNEIIFQSYRSNYDDKFLKKVPKSDFVVFFNPGFTCPDYNWIEALDTCVEQDKSRRVPFLITTNTEMEAISDLQFLHQKGYIDELPAMVADIVNDDVSEHETDIADYNDNNIFFGENPNSGTRVRQSGNMANDLFVKNRWIYGGLFSGGGESNEKRSSDNTKKQGKEKKTKKAGKKNSALM